MGLAKYTLALLLPVLSLAQSGGFTLGTSSLVVGPAPGNASVELLAPDPDSPWTAVSNAPWLALAPNSVNGSGSALIRFSYAANPGAGAQSGTLTVAGQNITVIQAGAGFAPANALSTVIGQGLSKPYAAALDAAGNLYIADAWNNTIEQWNPATQQMTPLVSDGLNRPHGVAVDGQGNVYIADTYNNAIEQWNPVTRQLTTLIPSGLNSPMGVAVDGQGNVYVADYGNNAIEQWSPSTRQLSKLADAGNPTGVAVDLLGNVYFADFRNNAIQQWSAATGVTTLVSTGLSFPNAVTADGQGNVYIVDGNHNALLEWNASTQAVNTLVSSGVNGSFGVAADGQGNFYIANTSTSCILRFSSGYGGLGVAGVTEGPQAGVDSVSVLTLGGNLPLAATVDQTWLAITGTTASSVSFSFQANTSVSSRTGHITVLGLQVTVTQNGDAPAYITRSAGDGQSTPSGMVFPAALQVTVTDAGGNPVQDAAVTFQVTPGAGGAGGIFDTTPPMPILTDQDGNATAPRLTANRIAGQFIVTASAAGLSTTFALTNSSNALGASSVLVGNAAGNGTVLLQANGPWVATSNAPWLQLAAGSQSGTGSSLIQFTYAANSNPGAQTGTLTIAGFTFTVVQAGTAYSQSALVKTLASGLNQPEGVALDPLGNVYIANTGSNAIVEWSAGTQQIIPLVSSGLRNPTGVAADQYGNVYIADSGNNAVEQWNPQTQYLTTLVQGLSNPLGIAADAQGNVYFSDTGHNAIGVWSAAAQQANTVIGSGLSSPWGVAVDAQGNIDFADSSNYAIKQYNAGSAQQATLVESGLTGPTGVAADGHGNVYFTDAGNNAIREWNAGSQQVVTLPVSGLSNPTGLAVDGPGNLYVADTNNGAVKKITLVYVSLSATTLSESAQAGVDSVTAQVLPSTTPVSATSDQSWLGITGVNGGVITLSIAANVSVASRTAHITVLGQVITVTQSADAVASLAKSAGDSQSAALAQSFAAALQVTVSDALGVAVQGAAVTFSVVPGASGAGATFAGSPAVQVLTDQSGHATAPVLTANGTAGSFTVTAAVNALTAAFSLTNLVYTLESSGRIVGSAAGSGSVWLQAGGPWSASSDAPWLQPAASSASGNGTTLIQFTYSANSGPAARTATLTISGLAFTVTQAGATYTPVSAVQTLVSTGLKSPQGLAVDAQGNVYIADSSNNAIREWSAATGTVSLLVSSGLSNPGGVAVDGAGNVYIADTGDSAIKKWSVADQQVASLVSTGLISPVGVAVDGQGNVYFSDTGHNSIKEWVAAGQQVTTLIPSTAGLSGPRGVAVDPVGNIYIADAKNNAIKAWTAANKLLAPLISTGLNAPRGVALDSQNNAYIADTSNNSIKEWSPPTSSVSTLVAAGMRAPSGVVVDGQGNVYIADTNDNAIKEFTAGYLALEYTSRNEGAQAGTDTVTALILPATLPLTATSNQSWLKITGTSGGAVAFSFTANTSITSRAAQITVLGQTVTITQSGDLPATVTKAGGNGQSAPEGQTYTTALQVRVTDAAGKPISGASVTFVAVAGPKGANGAFASSAPVLTNSSGYATASSLTASNITGSFTVTATSGSATTNFTLTVTP
ncbi:MAG TPA: BACON domain-containing carbohydrate-binding protein [Bryobacteraceae bacterium]|nr:BACON domain-containing carbohydrate-binding protein [Bryobacteraceae bacterium]